MRPLSKARQLTALRAHAQRAMVNMRLDGREQYKRSFAEASLVAQEYLHHAMEQYQAQGQEGWATGRSLLEIATQMYEYDRARWNNA